MNAENQNTVRSDELNGERMPCNLFTALSCTQEDRVEEKQKTDTEKIHVFTSNFLGVRQVLQASRKKSAMAKNKINKPTKTHIHHHTKPNTQSYE